MNSCNKKHIGKEMKQIFNLLSRFAESKANEEGVTFVQGRILHYIRFQGQGLICQKDIEKEFNIRGSSATEMLKKLEKYKLIERVEDENDKRSKNIHITANGAETEAKIFAGLCEFENAMKKGISEEEISIFHEVLDKLKDNLIEITEEGL